jgi:hypothetical protein
MKAAGIAARFVRPLKSLEKSVARTVVVFRRPSVADSRPFDFGVNWRRLEVFGIAAPSPSRARVHCLGMGHPSLTSEVERRGADKDIRGPRQRKLVSPTTISSKESLSRFDVFGRVGASQIDRRGGLEVSRGSLCIRGGWRFCAG